MNKRKHSFSPTHLFVFIMQKNLKPSAQHSLSELLVEFRILCAFFFYFFCILMEEFFINFFHPFHHFHHTSLAHPLNVDGAKLKTYFFSIPFFLGVFASYFTVIACLHFLSFSFFNLLSVLLFFFFFFHSLSVLLYLKCDKVNSNFTLLLYSRSLKLTRNVQTSIMCDILHVLNLSSDFALLRNDFVLCLI